MSPENNWLSQQIAELRRSMEHGMDQIQRDVDEVKTDVKKIHQEAVPYRVNTLEKWRDGMSARLWTFMIGCGVAAVSAWIAVVVAMTDQQS